MSDHVAIRCRVYGKVQGVFFRASTATEANGLGLTGHARNLADGSVEVLACGDEQGVARLREWLETGPQMARVERVECETVHQATAPRRFVTG
jgi:acylphosphatase